MVLVGDDEAGSEERIMVHVEMLKEPCMAAVLEMAAQQFGYGQPGVLRIPCGVDRFQQMVGAACEAR
jgi:SAUR family protein